MATNDQGVPDTSRVRGIAFVRWWTARYTRGLRLDVRERRIAEIASDLHEQSSSTEHSGHPRLAAAVVWRAVRGMPADLAWRKRERKTIRTGRINDDPRLLRVWSVMTQAWFAPIAVLVGLFDLLVGIAVRNEDRAKMPGQVIGPICTTALALSLFTGLWMRWKSGRETTASTRPVVATDETAKRAPMGSVLRLMVVTAGLTVALAMLTVGTATGSRALFFLARMLIVLTVLRLAVPVLVRSLRSRDRRARSQLADAMVIAGTFPALALFWMVVPALLAIAVIAGVVGTGPRIRPV